MASASGTDVFSEQGGVIPSADVPSAHDERQTLVIIGNGMTSYRLCQKLVENGVHQSIRIVVFGEERWPAYDRVHLTDIFGGRDGESLILAEEEWYEENGIELLLDDPIIYVDREHNIVESDSGRRVGYNSLVFATGSEPFVPPIEGIFIEEDDGTRHTRKGVFVYRTFDDVYNIEASVEGALRVAVIGGGLLGLEAAKAIYDLGQRLQAIDVCVIEVAPFLMPRQLDAQGAAILKEKIEELGVKVQTGKKITRISSTFVPSDDEEAGDDERPIVHFEDGSFLAADMLIVATGIRPRGELAKAAGLEVAPNNGILVDDRLQTSDEQIYAIGECACHKGITYGLVAPGYQMVDVLVANLLGEEAKFEGADQSAKLKLLGVTVAAFGEYDGDTKPLSSALRYTTGGVYRKLVTRQGKLIGAVTVGDWENLDRIREELLSPKPMANYDMRRFRSTGNLFSREDSLKVKDWAETAMVCGCMRVTRGALSQAIGEGCKTMAALCSKTGAGTVCGSCKPLLSELLDEDPNAVPPPMPAAAKTHVVSPLSIRERSAQRKERPLSRRTMSPTAPISTRRPSVPPMPAMRTSSMMNIIVPTNPPPSQGTERGRRRTLPMIELGGLLADTLPEVTGLPMIVERDNIEVPSSRRPSSRPPPAKQSRPSVRPPPMSPAESLEALARTVPPPLGPEEEVEVGLSSDRAPALLDEPARTTAELQMTPVPPISGLYDEAALGDEPEPEDEDFAEGEYEEEVQAAFGEQDRPLYDFGLVQARKSWVPPKRMSMLPAAPSPLAERPGSIAAAAGRKEAMPPEAGLRPLLVSSIASVLLSVVAVFSKPLPVPTTLHERLGPNRIFIDDTPRQITGYVLLGLCVLSLVLSLRKRIRRFTFLDVPTFRAIHGVIGASTLLGLVVHTGMRLGHRMNFVLAVDFLAVCVLGAAAGFVTYLSSRWSPLTARDRRLFSSRLHLFAFWPLPVLVALHVFQVYYY